MIINIVGLGNVGRALVEAYKTKKNTKIYVFDKDKTKILNTIDNKKVFPAKDVESFKNAYVTFITVVDNQILNVMDEISKAYKGNIVIMSGGLDIEDIKKHIKNLNNLVIMHPIQTFINFEEGKGLFKNIYFTIEYTDSKKICDEFCDEFGCLYFEVPKNFNRALYHTACMFASNFIVTIGYIASTLLIESNLSEENMDHILFPLMKNTIENMEKYGIRHSISGPVKRGDNEVIEKHIKKISDEDIKKIYKLLIKQSLKYFQETNYVILNENKIEDLINE